MGGRGSKGRKFTTGVLQPAPNQQNKGINFPGGRAAGVNQKDYNAITQEFYRLMSKETPWVSQLTPEEMTALYDYQGSDYRDMNKFLREKAKGNLFQISTLTRSSIDQTTSALDKASLSEPVVVYRGVNTHALTFAEAQGMVGTTVTDPAFGSTTLNSQFAQSWATSSHHATGTIDNPYITYRINMPTGAKAAFISASTGDQLGETELLVQRGAQYNITSASQRVINGSHYIFINANYAGQAKVNKVYRSKP